MIIVGVWYQLTSRRFSTWVTPGTCHAAVATSRRLSHAQILPERVTRPSSVMTVIPWASNSALRFHATSMTFLISLGRSSGLTSILLDTPLTPAGYFISTRCFFCRYIKKADANEQLDMFDCIGLLDNKPSSVRSAFYSVVQYVLCCE